MRQSLPVSLLATAVLATACGPTFAPAITPPLALPPPCANQDSVYRTVPADSVRGLRGPALRRLYLPPSEFHGAATVRLLVDSRGHVLADSTHVEPPSVKGAAALKRSVTQYEFWPATFGSCAVSSWFELYINR